MHGSIARMLVALNLTMAGLGWGAHAGTVLATPEQLNPSFPNEGYPESRFGQAPAKPEPGINSTFAAKSVEEMETPDDTLPKRAPASLNFSEDHPGRAPHKLPKLTPAMHEAAAPSSQPSTPGTAGLSTSIPKGVQEVGVIAGDLGYFPKTVFVVRDIPVRMFVTGASKNTLCIMMDSFQVRKQVRSQKIEEITFTPNLPGKYRFYCPVNGMEGTLVVKELASSNTGD